MQLLIQRHQNFDELKVAWQLLEPKAGCTLFTSWQWQQGWWRTWGEGLELQLLSFRTADNSVVGIAPLFIRRYRPAPTGLGQIVALRQLQPVGNIYPTSETVLSEYLDLVIDPRHVEAVYSAFSSLLETLDWDEMALPLITASSHYYRLFAAAPGTRNNHHYATSTQHAGPGISVNTSSEFSSYLATLGKNTRLKLYNRRALLNQSGTVTLEFANTNADAVSYLEQLNNMASARWGRRPFGPQSLRFHQQLAQQFASAGLLRLSRLSVDGTAISLLYNLRFGDTEYNIQAAYDEHFHAKISPGTLHLGYAIEQACQDDAITTFDLLFGAGKNVFYKQHFNGKTTEFFTITAARSVKARLIMSARTLYRHLRARIKKEPRIPSS